MQDTTQTSSAYTQTTTSLLLRLFDPADKEAWQTFRDRHHPAVVRSARRWGFAPHQADDISQEVFTAFYNSYTAHKYDREKGRLRHWLYGIARNVCLAAYKKHTKEAVTSPMSAFEPADEGMLMSIWDDEWLKNVMTRAMEIVRQEFSEHRVQAFVLYYLQGKRAKEVGALLEMTENAVFLAKHDIVNRLTELQHILDDG